MQNLPTLEEEATILAEENEPPEAAASLPECPEIPGPASRLNATSASPSPMSKSGHHPYQKTKKSQCGLRPTQASILVDLVLCGDEQNGTWLVEGIMVHSPLQEQVLHWLPCQRTSPLASSGLQAASCPNGKGWWVDQSTLSGCAVVKGLLSPKGIPRSLRLLSGQREEMVALAMALKRCTIWSRTPQECYAEQHRSSTCASPLWSNRAIY